MKIKDILFNTMLAVGVLFSSCVWNEKAEATLEEGVYEILPATRAHTINKPLVFDNGHLQLRGRPSNPGERWQVNRAGEGQYTIRNTEVPAPYGRLSVDLFVGQVTPTVHTGPIAGSAPVIADLWNIEPQEIGTYSIVVRRGNDEYYLTHAGEEDARITCFGGVCPSLDTLDREALLWRFFIVK